MSHAQAVVVVVVMVIQGPFSRHVRVIVLFRHSVVCFLFAPLAQAWRKSLAIVEHAGCLDPNHMRKLARTPPCSLILLLPGTPLSR